MKTPTLKYKANRPCAKCGGKEIADGFHAGDECRFSRRCEIFGVQHIKRHCKRCHFEWAELPIDAAGEGEGEK